MTAMTGDKKEMATPAVSIGLPVYNGEKYLREALDSVLAQTCQDFELIISDNASNDNTQAICKDYSERDPRIKYILQDRNLGAFGNFNFVLQEARGPLFTWFAHDDLLEPHFIEKSVEYMSARPETVLLAGDFKIIGDDDEDLGIEKLENIRDHIEWNRRCVEFFKYPISNVFFCIYGMMKTDTCRQVLQHIQQPKIMAGSELPILARFAAAGEVTSIPAVLRQYRRHATSVYVTELAELSKKSKLHRSWVSIGNLYRRRFDQMAVLLSSPLSPGLKLTIMFKVLFAYLKSFMGRISRMPVSVLRFIRA